MYASLLLLLLLSSATLCHFFFSKSGTLILAFFCITIIGAQEYHTTIYHTTQHTMPPLCLRSAFALAPLWLRFRRRRKTQGNAAAETRHNQEDFDKYASKPKGLQLAKGDFSLSLLNTNCTNVTNLLSESSCRDENE